MLSILSAIWLGILTSISPCPLATNVAAISFIGRRIDRTSAVLTAGLFYTIGRMAAYIVVAAIIVSSLLSVSQLSNFLQLYMNKLLGPILIVAGMFLLELLSLPAGKNLIGDAVQKRIEAMGVIGALLLGFLFALSFCPVSAALFFGSLIPLAIQAQSRIVLPLSYGAGTALPVILFSFLLAFGTRYVGRFFDMISVIERYARRVTGFIFIAVGVFISLRYIFGVV